MYGPPRKPPSDNIPKPKSFKEVFPYVFKVVKGFFSRYFFIFRLVWEASPFILVIMSLVTVINGVFPVLGAKIGAELITAVGDAINDRAGLAATFEGLNVFQSALAIFTETRIGFFILFELIYLVISSIVSNAYNAFISISSEKVANHIKVKIISKAKTIDVSQFDLPEFYEKFENASREASFRPIQILSSTFSMISNIISMISFIIVLIALNPLAPLIIFVISLPAAIIKFVYGRKNFLYMRRRSKDRRQMEYFSQIMTSKDIVKEVRLFNLSDTFIGKFKSIFKKYFKGLKSLILRENMWHIVIAIATAVVNAALFLYVGIKAVNDADFKIGDYSYYASALNSIIGCIGSIVASTATVYQGTLFIDNVIEFNKLEPKIVPTVSPALSVERHIAHEIEFRNVSFAYPGTDKLVLKNVSFTLKPGSTSVLVGLNGAGKTTIIKLLTRLYDPTDGVILLDGEDLRKYDTTELYSTFGAIFQDFGKYAVSIEENIYYGDIEKGFSEEDVIDAATKSGADDYINRMPDGYKTKLIRFFDEDATDLSIGQWQKLSVARAFYSDSDILILDEPTASLDAIAEQQIFKQFEELTENKTSIFVSHRLSSATTADNIIVVEYGEIIEQGNHKELMQKQGKYYELFTTQAKRYIENQN
ncbi:MAG: ABC transporter ATP-binding protein [Clostridia bacterium]|nr:ABC transporter ATP-binding protein [Clostridia bacterium]